MLLHVVQLVWDFVCESSRHASDKFVQRFHVCARVSLVSRIFTFKLFVSVNQWFSRVSMLSRSMLVCCGVCGRLCWSCHIGGLRVGARFGGCGHRASVGV